MKQHTPSALPARAPVARALASIALLGLLAPWPVIAQEPAFVLPASGCPMAHCDARMSDAVQATSPTVARRISIDRSSPGSKGGLGCVSNGSLVACTSGSTRSTLSNLIVYNADGVRLWEDGGILGSTAWLSAPMISTDGHVIADAVQFLDAKTRP